MFPYDFIYGRPYITPLSWNHLKYQAILGLKILQEMEEQMAKKMIVQQGCHELIVCQTVSTIACVFV